MAFFEELIIVGESAALAEFRDRLCSVEAEGWERDRDAESRFQAMRAGPPGALSFRWAGDTVRPSAGLWLHPRGPREIDLGSINPMTRGVILTPGQYGAILDDFEARVLQRARIGLDVDWHRFPERTGSEDVLTRAAARKFRSFVKNANPIVLDSLDVKRWNDFVIQVHRDETQLSAGSLDRWLRDEKIAESIRTHLIADYESARSLLEEYDQEVTRR